MIEYHENCDEAKKRIDDLIFKALTEIGTTVKAEAKSNCPVGVYPKNQHRTGGTLKKSIQYRSDRQNRAVHIGTNVEYGRWVHNGTVKQKANPFLTRSIENQLGDIQGIVKNTLKELDK